MNGGDSHNSSVAALGKMFDPMSYAGDAIFGADSQWNPHNIGTNIATKVNEYGSKITKPINQLNTKLTPGKAWIDAQVPILKQWNETVENRPGDAVAIAAATYFTGGALGAWGGAGGAGTAAAPAAGGTSAAVTGAGGGLGGMSTAITPSFVSGAGVAEAGTAAGMGGFAVAPAIITPQLATGVGATVGYGGGLGTLGTAGTNAAITAMTPELASLGSTAATGNFFTNMSLKEKADLLNNIRSQIKPQESQQDQNQQYEQPLAYTNFRNYQSNRF